MKGTVYLVGAGPGDPGLLTLRAADLLRRAEVVVYDEDIGGDLLSLVSPKAELLCGAKTDATRGQNGTGLSGLLVAKAREGKAVVRLTGGAPYELPQGAAEAEALAKAKVPFEVVPGVSSVQAVTTCAGIPLTHREHASCYTVVTETPADTGSGAESTWGALAQTPGTLVFPRGLSRLRHLTESLAAHGRSTDSPAALIRRGATGRQRSWVGTLGTLAELAERERVEAPALVVIGSVVQSRDPLNWFERRPLLGRRVVVTRARSQAAPLAAPLRELGADVLEIPVIQFGPPTEKTAILEALAGLNSYDWIVFTSANGVTAFFDLFFQAFQDMRDLGGARLAAVGTNTAARLRELHLQVDVVPTRFAATEVAAALRKFESMENLKILLPRAEKATPELPRLLEDLGAIVDDVPCYRTEPATSADAGVEQRLLESGADWLTFTSGSTIEQFHQRFNLPQLLARHPALRIATLGPETTQVLASLGLKPNLEAKPATAEGLVAALLKASAAEPH